ncbi:MAG: hypothetical protein PHN56_03190, partial [Candidatus Nanoarchaeia archaeon]|nr:hypothetical protein [Candidatus Nanoarchaeia archaeon]
MNKRFTYTCNLCQFEMNKKAKELVEEKYKLSPKFKLSDVATYHDKLMEDEEFRFRYEAFNKTRTTKESVTVPDVIERGKVFLVNIDEECPYCNNKITLEIDENITVRGSKLYFGTTVGNKSNKVVFRPNNVIDYLISNRNIIYGETEYEEEDFEHEGEIGKFIIKDKEIIFVSQSNQNNKSLEAMLNAQESIALNLLSKNNNKELTFKHVDSEENLSLINCKLEDRINSSKEYLVNLVLDP